MYTSLSVQGNTASLNISMIAMNWVAYVSGQFFQYFLRILGSNNSHPSESTVRFIVYDLSTL